MSQMVQTEYLVSVFAAITPLQPLAALIEAKAGTTRKRL